MSIPEGLDITLEEMLTIAEDTHWGPIIEQRRHKKDEWTYDENYYRVSKCMAGVYKQDPSMFVRCRYKYRKQDPTNLDYERTEIVAPDGEYKRYTLDLHYDGELLACVRISKEKADIFFSRADKREWRDALKDVKKIVAYQLRMKKINRVGE